VIAERLATLKARIAAACARVHRAPEEVTLVAVSKTKPAEQVREALAAGQRVFGENYVQELLPKQAAVGEGAIWHFVGRLQRNKAKDLVGRVALIHSVDGLALAETLARRAAQAGVVQDVLVEVNLGGEATKGGVAPAGVIALLDAITPISGIRVRGLMVMPPPAEDPRPHFRAARTLARDRGLPELSMGMSADFEVAIEEGSTLVRVGSAIFGER
jgi:pyridoxal phosphate enzyme (YggS family)